MALEQENDVVTIKRPADQILQTAEDVFFCCFFKVCYQLLKLNKVWKDILPLNIYHSALGSLLNVVLKKIIDEILKLEVRN